MERCEDCNKICTDLQSSEYDVASMVCCVCRFDYFCDECTARATAQFIAAGFEVKIENV